MAALCETLVQEHEVIEQVLDALEEESHVVASGGAVDRVFFTGVIGFVRKFADGIHHQKEEKVLFPALCDAGVPKDGGPVGVMLNEHDEGRHHIRAMEQALVDAAEGDADARENLVREGLGYVALLRAHIQKENMILFPMAEQVLDMSQQESVRNAIDALEEESRSEKAAHRQWVADMRRR